MPKRKRADDVLSSMVRRVKPVTKKGGKKTTPKGKRTTLEDKPMRFTGKGLTEEQRKKMLALMKKGGLTRPNRSYKV